MCGEQSTGSLLAEREPGSSPRVRGTAIIDTRPNDIVRFIPACAGNSDWSRDGQALAPVHPRVCGEQFGRHLRRSLPIGSSPRVRGTVVRERPPVRLERFIPACAGNRAMSLTTRYASSVHPRVCGEQTSRKRFTRRGDGSSPRVRGTDQLITDRDKTHRFIPACAGNSRGNNGPRERRSVHPRVCGEQRCELSDSHRKYGSSPRVRGTGPIFFAREQSLRFIPACAGNRSPYRARQSQQPVHPRVCGEQAFLKSAEISRSGSSPRVRGTVYRLWSAS